MSAPAAQHDLGSVLRAHARKSGAATAFVFLERGERESGRLSYAQLDLRARAIAAELQARGCEGERVLLAMPSGLEFVAAFFGCLYAGAVAVPAPEFENRRGAERAIAICDDCEPKLVLIEGSARRAAPVWQEWRQAGGLTELAVQDIANEAAQRWREPNLGDEPLAFLQYTSGSTSKPKGVMVTHAALLANIGMVVSGARIDCETRIVSWLPVYHDMGLVLGLLTPAYAGIQSVLLPPLSFLQQPLRWPRAVAHYRGTLSGAPSFAFDMCARAAERQAPSGMDLSDWKVAFCGAEPVRAGSLDRFARTFEPHGFRRAALLPVYGLAEATLLASIGTPGEGIITAPHPATGRELATCGAPAKGERLVIADPDTLAPLPETQIGEIMLAGPNVAAGYWRRAAESEATFGCRLQGENERRYLRTGDLGFLSGGRLAIVGRAKDLIIIRGENHHPEDIEASVGGAHPSLAASAGAAFSVETDTGEELVIVFEMARSDAPLSAAILQAVAARVADGHGLALHELALIRPLTLPRTANGKLRRRRCRELYLAGELPWVARLPVARRLS